MVIAGVQFINMGLKAFIFTKADEQMRVEYKQPLFPPVPVEKLSQIQADSAAGKQSALSEDQVNSINQWLADYKNYLDTRAKIDPVTTQRQQDASINLAMIIIGLPLYLYHWGIIRRETRRQEIV